MNATLNAAAVTENSIESVGDVLVKLPGILRASTGLAKDVLAALLGHAILQPLIPKTQVFVKQRNDSILKGCLCRLGNKQYDVKDSYGQTIYNIVENTNCCCRCCLKSHRPFKMAIQDDCNHAIVVNRSLACDSCLFGCCPNEVKVHTETGKYIGKVRQRWTCWKSKFLVHNGEGNVVCKIKGPACPCSACGGNVDFEIFTPGKEGVKVGAITKFWSGIATEIFTDADSFSVTFPIDMDAEVKATLISACLLIDFMYFEEKG